MLDFKDKLEKKIVDYFIKYNVNVSPINNSKIVMFDSENQIHYTNSIASSSNLNLVVSKNLVTKQQQDKALAIIKIWQVNKMPFTWVVVSNSQDAWEKTFFLPEGFTHTETLIAMVLDLQSFNEKVILNENEKINAIASIVDVEKFRNVIKNTFSLALIDLQKYYGLYQLGKTQKVNYQVYLTVADVPVAVGQFYYQDDLVIIDDIATDPKFQKRGLAKKVLNHLLNKAKSEGYQQAALVATPEGFPLYSKLGFQPLKLYFDVYEINY